MQLPKSCCWKKRGLLPFATKSVHVSRFNRPRQPCFAKNDVTPLYSRLSLNGHLCKTDTQSWSLPFFTPFIWLSIRRTLSAGPKGVRLRENWLYRVTNTSFYPIRSRYSRNLHKPDVAKARFTSYWITFHWLTPEDKIRIHARACNILYMSITL